MVRSVGTLWSVLVPFASESPRTPFVCKTRSKTPQGPVCRASKIVGAPVRNFRMMDTGDHPVPTRAASITAELATVVTLMMDNPISLDRIDTHVQCGPADVGSNCFPIRRPTPGVIQSG